MRWYSKLREMVSLSAEWDKATAEWQKINRMWGEVFAFKQMLQKHQVYLGHVASASALRSAAKDARERGDIGKEQGVEAWVWLDALAARHERDAFPERVTEIFQFGSAEPIASYYEGEHADIDVPHACDHAVCRYYGRGLPEDEYDQPLGEDPR